MTESEDRPQTLRSAYAMVAAHHGANPDQVYNLLRIARKHKALVWTITKLEAAFVRAKTGGNRQQAKAAKGGRKPKRGRELYALVGRRKINPNEPLIEAARSIIKSFDQSITEKRLEEESRALRDRLHYLNKKHKTDYAQVVDLDTAIPVDDFWEPQLPEHISRVPSTDTLEIIHRVISKRGRVEKPDSNSK